MSKRTCGDCGKAVPVKNKFCGSCGSSTLVDSNNAAIGSKSMEEIEITEKAKANSNAKLIYTITFGFIAILVLAIVMQRIAPEAYVQESQTQSSQNSVQAEPTPIPTETSILDEDAYQFINRGQALVTLQSIWGISLSNGSGYITLRELADNCFDYLQSTVNTEITKENIRVGFEPGNSLNSFFSRLLNDTDAYMAVMDRMLYQAA